MADTTALKNRIRAAIKANDNQEITGPVLQQTLLDIVDELDLNPELENEARQRQTADTQLGDLITGIKNNIDNGYVYAGIATPSTAPVSGKVFYIALQAGTYTNFGSQVVLGGITILKYNGSAWSKEQVLSNNYLKLTGLGSGSKIAITLNSTIDVAFNNTSAKHYCFNEKDYFEISTNHIQSISMPKIATGYYYIYLVKGVGLAYSNNILAVPDNATLISSFYKAENSIYLLWNSPKVISYSGFSGVYNSDGTFYSDKTPNFYKLTNINNSHKIVINNNTSTFDIAFDSTDIEHYYYNEKRYYPVPTSQVQTLSIPKISAKNYYILLVPGVGLSYCNDIQDIPDESTLICSFYCGGGNVIYLLWNSSNLVRYSGFTIYNDNGSFYNSAKSQNIARFTDTFYRTFTFTYDNTNKAIVVTTNGTTNSCVIVSDIFKNNINYPDYASSISLPLNTSTDWLVHYIYFDIVSKSIKITLDINDVEGNILMESFIVAMGSPQIGIWYSPLIQHSNYPSAFDTSKQVFLPNWRDYNDVKAKSLGVQLNSINTFRRIGCIGDSYAEGWIKIDEQQQIWDKNYSWPTYLQNKTGQTVTNFAKSGSTAKDWVTGQANLADVQAQGNKCQAYIIGLMINDTYYYDCGTSADIGTDANTYYAWFYKLIQAVVSVNTDAKIFALTCPKTSTLFSQFNQAVRDIVSYCQTNSQKVFLIDLDADYKNEIYFLNPLFVNDAINGHYTAIGYEFMAECLFRIISDFMANNISSFQDVYRIPFDIEQI